VGNFLACLTQSVYSGTHRFNPAQGMIAAFLAPGFSAIVPFLKPATTAYNLTARRLRWAIRWGMQKTSDSTQNTITSLDENVVNLDHARLAKRFYDAQEQDVFQQKLEGLMDRLAMQSALNVELFDLLSDLRGRLR
jgi:hypothetical protein